MTFVAPSVALACVLVEAVLLWRSRAALERMGASLAVAGAAFGVFAFLGGGLALVFRAADLSLESDAPFLWLYVCGGALAVGLGLAARTRRVAALELSLAGLAILQLAAGLAIGAAGVEGMASPAIRAFLTAPPALAAFGYFGASLGYLLWGTGRLERLGYEGLIGKRFLLAKASETLSTVTAMSVIGVMLGVWLVIVALGVLSGFESDLRHKIIGANAHAIVQRVDAQTFVPPARLDAALRANKEVAASAPFLQGEVATASTRNMSAAAVLFGIDPAASTPVLEVLSQLQHGSLTRLADEQRAASADGDEVSDTETATVTDTEFAPPAATPGVVIGSEMAKSLAVRVGDRIRILSPLLEVLTPVGVAPKSLGLEVVGVFTTKMYEFDARYAFVSLPTARRFFEVADDEIQGLHLATVDPERADRVARQLGAEISADGLEVRDWKSRNQTLFAALKLEKVVAFVVLVFVILVASFAVVNTLTMSIIEKKKAIAILKTMGARDVGIMKIFLVQGLIVGVVGTFLGCLLAVITVAVLERIGFWIPGDVYYIDALPVELAGSDVVLVVLAALLIVWNFAVFPALEGSGLLPVEGLRDG